MTRTTKIRLAIIVPLLFSAAHMGLSDSFVKPTPYTVTSRNGRFSFAVRPKWDNNNAESTCYETLKSGKSKERWSIKSWWRGTYFLANDGKHLVRVVGAPFGKKPMKEHIGIEFYSDGKLLARHSPVVMLNDPSLVVRTVARYAWLDIAEPGTEGFFGDAQEKFILTTIEGTTIIFDCATGKLLEKRPPKQKRTKEDIYKLVK